MAETTDQDEDIAERVAGEAYQVIGALADAAGLFDHPEVIQALDYFGYARWRDPGKEILPFQLPDVVMKRAAAGRADADERRQRLRGALGKGPGKRFKP